MDHGPSAEQRILHAAMHRFAVDGLGTPLRTVAREAGVSAGLIIHHYGSREKLLEACDQHTLRITRENKLKVIAGGAPAMLAQLAGIERFAPAIGYVLRRLRAGGPFAEQLIDDFAADAQDYLAQGTAAGLVSPSRDPEARARALTQMALGALLLQMPADGDTLDLAQLPAWLRTYSEQLFAPMLEIYSEPLLTDTSLLEAYLTREDGAEHPAPTTKGTPS